jgi:hypothetical protein
MIAMPPMPVRDLAPDRLYDASRTPELVRVPELTFAMIDGQGDPNTAPTYGDALNALYGVSYTLKFALRRELGLTYRVGPLEGLWWTDDMAAFSVAHKGDWRWTMMIAQPDEVTAERFEGARDEVRRKKGLEALERIRLERFTEGLAAQVLYIGPYRDEGPTIERLHAFIRDAGCRLDRKHHEIYLGDPRRSAPERLRTIIRQPVAGSRDASQEG